MRFISFLPAILWFVISVILLALPGNDLPQSHFFDIPFFDKYIHTIMFFLLTSLFCYPFIFSGKKTAVITSSFLIVTVCAVIYGVAMEFVQKYLVYGRSFDLTDILFDGVGSVAGLAVVSLILKKKNRPQ